MTPLTLASSSSGELPEAAKTVCSSQKKRIARGQKDAWPGYTGAEASRGQKHQAADNDFLDQAPFSKLIRAPEA